MNRSKLRRQIAWEAARLMHECQETDFYRARKSATRRLCRGWVKPADMPTQNEVLEEVQRFSAERYGQSSGVVEAARDDVARNELANHLAADDESRFAAYEALLLPCESVSGRATTHPEGDVLYHSLQVFYLARQRAPYDEEFLTACLLHDIGKAIDPRNHVAAALAALDGLITERTAWFIENHPLAHAAADRSIGLRAHRRLRGSADYDELMLLGECDRAGRRPGGPAPELGEALQYLRELAAACEDG